MIVFMRISHLFLFAVPLALLLPSCGRLNEKFGRQKTEGITQVVFQSSQSPSPSAAILNGIMVYAVRADNPARRASRFFANELDQKTWALPSGQYNFYAVGYPDPTTMANMYCAKTDLVDLKGDTATVGLVLDEQGVCGTPPFTPAGYGATADSPFPLKFGVCDPITSGTNIGLTGVSLFCDNTSGRPNFFAAAAYRVSLLEYNTLDGSPPSTSNLGPNPIQAACQSGTFAGNAPAVLSVKLPLGAFFPVRWASFATAGCTGVNVSTFYLWKGFVGGPNNGNNLMLDTSLAPIFPSNQMLNFFSNGSSNNYLLVHGA